MNPERLEALRSLIQLVGGLAVVQVEIAIAAAGAGLLVLMAAPERHGRAAARLASGPGPSFLLGALALLVPAVLLLALLHAGIQPGRLLLAAVLVLAGGAGLSVTARRLGSRVLPDHGPLAQTATGLAATVPLLAWVPLLPVVLALAAAGLGAWLRPDREVSAR